MTREKRRKTSPTFGEKVVAFNKKLRYQGPLPPGFAVINPFFDNPETIELMTQFYQKFYGDRNPRRFMIGINPSRHGAGLTGVPFTDTKRLEACCGIKMKSAYSHEVSSVFMYDMISGYGGVEKFYSNFYINSPFPLAIIRNSGGRNWTNANYYDDRQLMEAAEPFMVESMKHHISLGLKTDGVYVLGKKNADCLRRLNKSHHLFDKMVVLEHPRYIQQYKYKEREAYIDKYLAELQKI